MSTKIGPREQALREARAKPTERGIFITPLVGTIQPGVIVTAADGKSGRIVATTPRLPPKKARLKPKKKGSKR